MDEIINKISSSSLITIDLEREYKEINPQIIKLDIQQFLFEGIILKEKDFREKLKTHNWEQYRKKYVILYCSEDTILPGWTYLLINTYLSPYSSLTIIGSEIDLNTVILNKFIRELDITSFKEKRIIIKGCGKLKFHTQVYLNLIEKLQPVVKALLYGEACSNVPLFKKTYIK